MLNVRQIRVSAAALALAGTALTACGQKGALYLPTDPAAKDRATLPSLLVPTMPSANADGAATQSPAAASSAPATTGGAK